VQGADYIQESVSERLDLKHRVYAEIQAGAPDVPIGSSTSGFKPSELQEGARTPHDLRRAPVQPGLPAAAGRGRAIARLRSRTHGRAKEILREIGMFPLHVRKEIDAHIADRFLEAVWREALWLVKDGIATTEEIDEAIRMGFGLRWGQMGLFETYRIAGGEAGMRHFLAQFGPCLTWPWTKLMDVPEFNDELVDLIAGQSDAQSGHCRSANWNASATQPGGLPARAEGARLGRGRVLRNMTPPAPACPTPRRTPPRRWSWRRCRSCPAGSTTTAT
jgi:carnitine 3-dehydrogenase